MMYILTLKDRPDGVFSVLDDTGDHVIPIFEREDDAERYQIQLEIVAEKYDLQVVEISEEIIVNACVEKDQKYAIITIDDLIVPPDDLE